MGHHDAPNACRDGFFKISASIFDAKKRKGCEMKIKKVACNLCHKNCGMLAYLENGEIVNVSKDPKHPFNVGAQCPKGACALDELYHPNRINYPLKRVGERGSGQFIRVTWKEAMDDIAGMLARIKNEHGAEAISYQRC